MYSNNANKIRLSHSNQSGIHANCTACDANQTLDNINPVDSIGGDDAR